MKIDKKIIITILIIAIVGVSSIVLVLLSIFPEGKRTPPDLTDRGPLYSDFSPTAVKPGSTLFQVWCHVENLGESSTGDFNISFYASTNTIITADDYLIGIDSVSSISSLNYSFSRWDGIFPSSGIPDGNYYIGWIIDSEDDVSESDEANNIAYVSSYQLIVDSVNPSSSISYTPESIPNIVSNNTKFTLSADDGTGSGVNSIEYRIDNGAWTSYTEPFTLEGYAKRNHTIEYYSIDNAGNQEIINNETVTKDIPYLYSGVLFAPGAPIDTPEDHIIKIGALADLNDITGEGTFQGSYLAIEQINSRGGITISGSTDPSFPNGTYYFGLIAENTYECDPIPDLAKGVLAAVKMYYHNADFIIGGFRTEVLTAYRETVMDYQKIFIGTGASADSFCQDVHDDYHKYKYWFRAMPINSTSSGSEIIKYFAYLRSYLEAELGRSITKWALLYEDLDWTTSLVSAFKAYLPVFGWDAIPSVEIAFPPTATLNDFAQYWTDIENNSVQVVIPLVSNQNGILMTKQYAALQPRCLIAGLDAMSQLGDDPDDTEGYWNITGGTCAYEVIMQSIMRTNNTNLTIPMWNSYTTLWDKDPYYTAIGSFDSVFMLCDAINTTQSIDSDEIITQLETINKSNPLEGAGGNIAFNANHDLIEGYDPITEKIFVVGLMVQWQAGGTKSIISSGGYIYPEWIVDAPLQIPPWGINS